MITRRSIALAALLSLPAAAAPPETFPEPAQFKREQLRVAGRLTSVHAEDLDGDGKRDLIALFVQGAPPVTTRWIALFYDRGGYHAEADQVVAAPAGASFVQAFDVDGDGKRELLFGDSRGLAYLQAGEKGFAGESKRLALVEGLALLADDEELPWLVVGRDWDGDGKPEILLPTVDRIAVVTRASDGSWSRSGELRLPPRATYAVRGDGFEPRARNYSLHAGLTVPELELGDYDGDGKADLIAVLDDTVTVFLRQPQGGFAPGAAAKIHLGARSEQEAARGNAAIQTSVLDLDGDGVADLAVNKTVGGLSSMRAQTGFYYGRKGGGYGRPAQVISREGFAGALLFADLDGDHRPELVMCHAQVGFAEAARILISKRLSVGFEVHRNHGAKGFTDKPDAERPIDFPVDYSAGAELDGPFPTLDGDFNGDGRPDFAGPKDPGTIAVWLGGGKQLIDEYPRAIVHVPATRFWRVLDLDGDKRADVLLYYRFRAERQGLIVVLRNTGRGW